MYGIKVGDVTTDGTDNQGNCHICDAQFEGPSSEIRRERAVPCDPRIRVPQLLPGVYADLRIQRLSEGEEVIISIPTHAVAALIALEIEELDEVEYAFLAEEFGTIDFYRPPGTNKLRFLFMSNQLEEPITERDYIDIVRLRSMQSGAIELSFESDPAFNYVVDYEMNSIALRMSTSTGVALVGLSPKPATDYITLYFSQWLKEGLLEVQVYDITGNLVMEEASQVTEPLMTKRIELSAVSSPGMYICRVKTTEGVFSKTFFIFK